MPAEITIIGGGLAGLVAANAAAEKGAAVRLYEAHTDLGGRARAIEGPYLAHEGGHVFYADGPHWTWLTRRRLVQPLAWPPLRKAAGARWLHQGRLRHTPPPSVLRMAARPWLKAPVDEDFRSWATRLYGPDTARDAANAIAVATYDADTGRLSAAFVWGLITRVYGLRVPAVRWTAGGWQAVVDRLAARARSLGVEIETGARVTEVPLDRGPAIVATELSSARRLLDDDSLEWESGHCMLMDLAVKERRDDPFLCFDVDGGGFFESYAQQDPGAAPAGEDLYQLQVPMHSSESSEQGRERARALADSGIRDWRDRVTWQRTAQARGRSGALDLPGRTWRDRPAIDRGDGVLLAGDMVAAPGMRGEISINSALRAASLALRQTARTKAAQG
ncbi:NAD(P)-binding protein [Nocardiopsis sp. RSe5-2]|uniref:NAD(P)-binding protein n=1 Tax=Nocardiopsis endophytica TaxID=3018445 RepID=A0ABT4U263_9ACTN|nr:NAD(P)-binding protein [Nocardiopsis endophytica]MDA2811033.1 NAD(P)-binding protein [Nocardiopsis endophytica]